MGEGGLFPGDEIGWFAHPLQEIKKKKGIKEEVQLTSKQKEMLQAQLDREAQVRRRLQEVSGHPRHILTPEECWVAWSRSLLSQAGPC